MVIEIERSESDMAKEVWRFVMLDRALVVEEYRYAAKATRRHALKTVRIWQRLPSFCVAKDAVQINELDVPLPDDVAQEARQEFVKQLQVGFLSKIRGGK